MNSNKNLSETKSTEVNCQVFDPNSCDREQAAFTPIMQSYTHVLWDWNGTLLDDSCACVDILNSLLSEQDLAPLELETYREIFEFPVHRFYKNLSSELDESTLSYMSNQFVGAYQKVWRNCQLHGDARATLQHFQAADTRQIVLSASDQDTLDACLNYFGLSTLFEKIIGQDNCHAHGKLETARRWLENSGVEPSKILLVGDTLHDLEISSELGFDCALFSQGHNSETRLRKAHSWVIRELSQLQRVG